MLYNSLRELPERYKHTIRKVTKDIVEFGLSDLVQITLFGSCSRLDIKVGSDVDLMVVTSNEIQDRVTRADLITLGEDLELDIKCDVICVDTKMLEESNERIIKRIRSEGICLWKDGEFTDEFKDIL